MVKSISEIFYFKPRYLPPHLTLRSLYLINTFLFSSAVIKQKKRYKENIMQPRTNFVVVVVDIFRRVKNLEYRGGLLTTTKTTIKSRGHTKNPCFYLIS